MKRFKSWWQGRVKKRGTYSLRATLITSIVVSTLLVSGMSLSITTYLSWDQTKDVLDEALKRSAQTLAHFAHRENLSGKPVRGHVELDDDEFYFQIITQGNVVAKSGSAPNFPFIANDHGNVKGFKTTEIDGEDWRVFVLKPRHGNFEVQVAHAVEMRYEFLEDLAEELMIAGILILIVSLLFNGLLVYFGLKPLTEMTGQIEKVSPKNLSPIDVDSRAKEIIAIEESLNMLLVNLEIARRHERQFTADASHELRTPLSAIQMKLQLLKRQRPELVSDLKPLQHDVERATHLIEHLMLLARLDPMSVDSSDELVRKPLVVSQLFDDVVQSYQNEVNAKSMQIIADECEITFNGNYDLLFVALKNLMGNAIKYSPNGSEIRMLVQESALSLDIIVKDNGKGVNADELERLSQRFYRVLGTNEIGSGLGLSIVKKIVELHQGEMKLRSKPDVEGLEITLHFPKNEIVA